MSIVSGYLETLQIVTSYIASSDDTSAAVRLINQQKNRSLDFLPTDLKRVVLPAKPGIYGSDYINASYLQVPRH